MGKRGRKTSLTRTQKEFRDVAKELGGVSLSNKQVREYQELVQKVNKKMSRLKKSESYVGDTFDFVFSAKNLSSKKQFNAWVKSGERILQRDFAKKQFNKVKANLERNIEKIYGEKYSIDLNAKQLNKFLKENKVFKSLTYYTTKDKDTNAAKAMFDNFDALKSEVEYFDSKKV